MSSYLLEYMQYPVDYTYNNNMAKAVGLLDLLGARNCKGKVTASHHIAEKCMLDLTPHE